MRLLPAGLLVVTACGFRAGTEAPADGPPIVVAIDAAVDARTEPADAARHHPDAREPIDAGPAVDAAPDGPPADAAPPPPGSPDGTGNGDTATSGDAGIDPTGPFFTALGTNGRSCATCHDQTTGWTVTPAALQARFTASNGTDPAFRTNDGTTSPTADVSTPAAMQTAYALLLSRGVFRIGLPIPAGADFTLSAVDDPYGFASAAELSLFRRPRPSTNLPFTVQVMWDGREPSLAHQATDATLGHAQAASADPATMTAIASFESTLYTAQTFDTQAGLLPGPAALAQQAFYAGINDAFGADPTGAPFTQNVFTVFTAFANAGGATAAAQKQASIARGEAIFNTKGFTIANVDGIPANTRGTCSTCHDTPNVGDHSIPLALNIGIAAANRRAPTIPLYTLLDTATGATIQVTDPGVALVSGKFADAGKFYVPVLRGLPMRAPYFHDGSAPNIAAVIQFYDTRFNVHFAPQERTDLAAFLGAL